jgi:hypothetical protein
MLRPPILWRFLWARLPVGKDLAAHSGPMVARDQVLGTRMQSCGGSPGSRRHRSASGVEFVPSHHDLDITGHLVIIRHGGEACHTGRPALRSGGPLFGGRKRLRASTNLRSFSQPWTTPACSSTKGLLSSSSPRKNRFGPGAGPDHLRRCRECSDAPAGTPIRDPRRGADGSPCS